MSRLREGHALADGTAPALSPSGVASLLGEVPEWRIDSGRLIWDVRLLNFAVALALVNEIGALAEAENHHPDILLHRWNRVRVEFYTHSAEGLTQNDFVLAARVSDLYERFQRDR